MTDQTGCSNGDNPYKFCCPGDVDLPTCQWRGMPKRGGNCSPGCNDDKVESACCTVTPSTSPYGQCKWVGIANLCSSSGSHADCPSDYLTVAFASSNGAGGEQTCSQGGKSYCCKGDSLIERYMQDLGAPPDFKSYSWSPEENQALLTRTVLNSYDFRLFNTYNARTMASNVQPLIDLYDDTGPPVEFRDHFLMAEMNAVIEGAGDRIDPYAYVSDLIANPHTANVAMDYMDTAAADLCTLVDDESTVSSKRSAPPLGNLENDYDPDLLKRHINVVDASTEPKVGGQPTMRTILRGIGNGDLTLHYARWEHFGDLNNDGRSAGPLLEIAYWIGREVGTLGSNVNLYQDSDEDRWVVFHFHYANDANLLRTSKKTPIAYFGCTSVTVYHGQRIDNNTPYGDNRIWNLDSGRDGNPEMANTRSRALNCPGRRRWYIGEATVPRISRGPSIQFNLRTRQHLSRDIYTCPISDVWEWNESQFYHART
ncbi:hypothetical protein BJX96DRAFT_182477 [Aspergillus floccosus]